MMLDKMRAWIDSTGNKGEILNRLTSDAVRQHRNVRPGHTGGDTHVHNALLPEGGLQAVVASHNIHVVSSSIILVIGELTFSLELRCSMLARTSWVARW